VSTEIEMMLWYKDYLGNIDQETFSVFSLIHTSYHQL